METIVDAIFFETGVHPALLSPASDPDLEEGWFQVQINSMPLPPTRGLEAEQLLVDCAPAELLALDVEADPFRSPVSGRMVALVTDAEDREAVGASGHQSWGPIGYVALHLAIAMRKNLGALYTKAKWIFYALQLRLVLPELVDHVMNTWDARDLSRILRYLLDEGIGIRDMRSILEMLAEPREITPMDLSKYIVFTLAGGAPVPDSYVLDGRQITAGAMGEMARNALKRSISYHYALGGNSLELYLVDHGAEKVISGPEFQDPLGPAARRYASKFRDEVRKEVGFVAPHGRKPVILTTAAVRRRVRELVRLEFPDLHVLSYQELSPDMDLQPLARIKVA